MNKLLSFVSCICLLNILNCILADDDNSVCYNEHRYTVLEPHKTTQPVKIRSVNWCLSFPPRCSNYRTEIKEVLKLQNITKTQIIEQCCEGYVESKYNNHNTTTKICSPICRGGCGQGFCASPNSCSCNVGYKGRHCMQRCRANMYGENCKNVCKCRNDSLCDHKTGFCRCSSGWIGKLCENPCPKGFYGVMCHNKCECNANNMCNAQTGECFSDDSRILFDLSKQLSSNVMRLSEQNERIPANSWTNMNDVDNCTNLDNCTKVKEKILLDINRTPIESSNKSENLPPMTILINPTFENNVAIDLDKEQQSSKKSLNDLEQAQSTSILMVNHPTFTDTFDTSDEAQQKSIVIFDNNNRPNILQTNILQTNNIDINHENHVNILSDDEDFNALNESLHKFLNQHQENNNNSTLTEMKSPEMVPVTLIVLIVLSITCLILFTCIYLIRRNREFNRLTTAARQQDIMLQDQVIQKPLYDIPSLVQQDFYNKPDNNISIRAGLNKFGYSSYLIDNATPARQMNTYNDTADGSRQPSKEENIYDEINYYSQARDMEAKR